MAADPTADLLVCGSCQRNFPLGNIVNFVQHKKFDCSELDFARPESGTSAFLSCQSCPRQFGTPWSLLKHAQNVHALKIYLEHGVFTRRVASIDGSTDLALESVGADMSIVVDQMFSRDDGKASPVEDIENVAPCEVLNARKSTDKITDSDNTSVHASDSAYQTKSASPVQATAGDEDWKLICVEEETAELHLNKGSTKSFVDADDAGRPSAGLEKCCTAVVPKKRKRHMEIKHGGMGSAKRTGGLQNKPTSIFIDLEPSGTEGQGFRASVLQCDDDSNKQSDWPSLDTGIRRHSVIIQPGTTFSIPVSYAGTPSHSGTTTSHCQIPSSIQVGMVDEQHRQPQQQQQADGTNRSHSAGASVVPGGERVGFDERRSALSGASAASFTTTASNVLVIGFGGDSAVKDGQADEHEADGTQSNHARRRRYPTSRPFKCDQCDDSFNQRVHLKKHQSKHTGVKPFKCDQCDYSTVERSHLKVHIRVHTGEKPYKCTFCKYATAQNSTLKIHLKRHHLDTAVAGASNSAGTAVCDTSTGVQVACTSATSVPSAFCCCKCGEQFEQHDMFLSHAMNEHPAAVGDLQSQSPNTPASCEMKFSASSAFHAGIDEHHTYALPPKNTLSSDATPTVAKSASKQFDKSHTPKDGEAKAD